MDFDLSADQVALRDAAAALLDRLAPSERVRAHVGPGVVVGTQPGSGGAGGGLAGSGATAAQRADSSAPNGFDRDLWAAMASQGWLAVERPESAGGLGLGMVEVAILAEELGRRVAPAPFLPTVLALAVLDPAGEPVSADLPAALVASLAEGRSVGCIADASRSAPVVSEVRDGGTVLTGRPEPVVYGPSADVAVVCTDSAAFAVLLDGTNRPAPQSCMDRTRELGWLDLVSTPAVAVGDAVTARRTLDRAATAYAAELLGVASTALDMAVAYAKERVQFGKPIGSFQAIKHMLADSLVDVEGMRSVVYYAAWCLAAGDPDSSLAASMAKAWCSDAARRVTATALQVHGGIGFTWEHDLHLFLKRAQLDQVSFGDAAWHRDRISSILRERVASGRGVL